MEMLTLARCGTHGVDWFGILMIWLVISGLFANILLIIEVGWWLFDKVWSKIRSKKDSEEENSEETLDSEEEQS